MSIELNHLTKSFASYKKAPGLMGSLKSIFKREELLKVAVDSASFHIKKGEMIGLLGPNGAGKTTLMKMMTGIIYPSSGEISVLGHNPSDRDKSFRKKIALVMGQKGQLWWDLPADDSFKLLQKYYEVSDEDFKARVSHLGELLGVKDLLHIQVRKLSLGERMKLELMAALLHSPEVIFLDEPTIGLDLIAQENIRAFLKDYHEKNKCTIIVTSHYMGDVQELCDRIILIHSGINVYDGPVDKFATLLGTDKQLQLTLQNPLQAERKCWQRLSAEYSEDLLTVKLKVPDGELRSVVLEAFTELDIIDIKTEEIPIERVMKEIIKHPELLRKQGPSN